MKHFAIIFLTLTLAQFTFAGAILDARFDSKTKLLYVDVAYDVKTKPLSFELLDFSPCEISEGQQNTAVRMVQGAPLDGNEEESLVQYNVGPFDLSALECMPSTLMLRWTNSHFAVELK